MMESYQAFGDVADVIELTETLVVNAAARCRLDVIDIAGTQVDLAEPWPRHACPTPCRRPWPAVHPTTPWRRCGHRRDARCAMGAIVGSGKLIEELFEKVCEDGIVRPTFVIGHRRGVATGRPGRPARCGSVRAVHQRQ